MKSERLVSPAGLSKVVFQAEDSSTIEAFRSGQKFDHTIFFGENVDIHHIFPQDWCKNLGIKPNVYDSIINKTPLSYRDEPNYRWCCAI